MYYQLAIYTPDLMDWESFQSISNNLFEYLGHEVFEYGIVDERFRVRTWKRKTAQKKKVDFGEIAKEKILRVSSHAFFPPSEDGELYRYVYITLSFSKVLYPKEEEYYLATLWIDDRVASSRLIDNVPNVLCSEFCNFTSNIFGFSEYFRTVNTMRDYLSGGGCTELEVSIKHPLVLELYKYYEIEKRIERMDSGIFRNVYRSNILNSKQFATLREVFNFDGLNVPYGSIDEICNGVYLWSVDENQRYLAFDTLVAERKTLYQSFQSSVGIY